MQAGGYLTIYLVPKSGCIYRGLIMEVNNVLELHSSGLRLTQTRAGMLINPTGAMIPPPHQPYRRKISRVGRIQAGRCLIVDLIPKSACIYRGIIMNVSCGMEQIDPARG